MNIIDIVIILIILCGAVIGFKRGVLNELVMTVGFVLVFVISFYLKDYLAEWMSVYLPFFEFGGVIKGVTVLNIILYQVIAFILVFSVIMILFRLLLTITGIIEKILKFTIILGIPSKLLGAVVGAIEGYIIAFIVVFALNQPMLDVGIMDSSKMKDTLLNSTPVLTKVVSSVGDTVDDVYHLIDSKEYENNPTAFNLKAIDIMLEHKMIRTGYVERLIDYGKIRIPGIDEVLNKYR